MSCNPPRTLSPSKRRVHNYFYANLCQGSTYDDPRVPPYHCSPPSLHFQICGQAHRGEDTSQRHCRMPRNPRTRNRGRGRRGVLVLHHHSLRVTSSPGHAYTQDGKSEDNGHIEFCVCVCVRAFAFSRMRLSRLRERDMDAFVGCLVYLGSQTPVKSLH
ncbi:hypothetical protein EDD85DRAFT_164320 [Armillaria nabsnona]|nr:hypothetical protein EDD85DRAFT_164320 [Armillaria nabsnona]